MSNQPGNSSETEPAALTLDYATRFGEYPESGLHPRMISLLIGLTSVAGVWSVILGIFFVADTWLLGLLLCGAGASLCCATMRELSAANLRIALLAVAILLAAPTAFLAHECLAPNPCLDVSKLAAMHSNWMHSPVEAESWVVIYELIRSSAIIATLLATGCLLYAVLRHARSDVGRSR